MTNASRREIFGCVGLLGALTLFAHASWVTGLNANALTHASIVELLLASFLIPCAWLCFSDAIRDEIQIGRYLLQSTIYLAPAIVILAALAFASTAQTTGASVGLVAIAAVAAWYAVYVWRKWNDGLGKSLKAYQDALRADPITFHPVDLTQRVTDRLAQTSLNFDDLIIALNEATTKDVPEPPWILFDIHAHIHYRQDLSDRLARSGTSSQELEDVFVETVVQALIPIAVQFPPISGEVLFTTAVIDRLDFRGDLIKNVLLPFHQPRVAALRIFKGLTDTLAKNIAEVDAIKIKPNITQQDIVRAVVKGTKLAELFELRVPLGVRDDLWFEHTHIIARPGSFKTQLIQTIILNQITRPQPPSFVVIDSQNSMLQMLEQKFGPSYGPKLIHIDPEKNPLPLNPLDVELTGLSEEDRGRIINRLAQLFVNLFTTGAVEMSSKMTTLFDHLLLLLIEGIPKAESRKATLEDLRQFLQSPKPQEKYAAAIQKLATRDQPFFSKSNLSSYSDTMTQVLQRLDAVLREPRMRKMLTAEHNQVDVRSLINSGGMVLVNTNKDYLQEQNSAFFGGIFILLAQQAIFSRKPTENPYPTFFIADECQEYFKNAATIDTFISQGRKFGAACVFAHHRFSQASSSLQDAFQSCAIHFATRVIPADLSTLAAIFHTTPAFMLAQQRERTMPGVLPRWCDYALYHGDLNSAVSVRVQYGNLENFDPATLGARRSGPRPGAGPRSSSGAGPRQNAPPPPPPPPNKGSDERYDLEFEEVISPAKMRAGGEHTIQVPSEGKVKIHIPSGSRYNSRVRIPGFGLAKPDGTMGDIWVVLKQHPDTINPDDMDTGAQTWPP